MAEDTIVQNMISRLGQSQSERLPVELGPHYADVDERTTTDLLKFAREFARMVRFEPLPAAPPEPAGDWSPFFGYTDEGAAALSAAADGAASPHLALFVAFLKLYEVPREQINQLTGRHLSFFYERVLRFTKRGPSPDRAHVVVELKKGSPPVLVHRGHRFSAGKDAAGELIYAPTFDTVINTARISSLRSVLVDRRNRHRIHFAAEANSADGFGAPSPDPRFRPFGHTGLPAAEVGWSIAAPVLRMREGRRRITVSLRVSNLDPARLTDDALAGTFKAFVTGEKSWLGPFPVLATLVGDRLRCEIDVPETSPAVVDYKRDVHQYDYAAEAPILQVLLDANAALGYADFKGATVESAQVSVTVSGLTTLALESDAGTLDPKKAFLPFGAQPATGSRFLVGCPEALAKNLSALALTIEWHGLPASLSSHYANYGVAGVGDAYFTASIAFSDGGAWKYQRTGVGLFAPRNDRGETVIDFGQAATSSPPAPSSGQLVYTLSTAGTSWARMAALRYVRISPIFHAFLRTPPQAREGFIVLALDRDFLHARFRQKSIENALKRAVTSTGDPIVLNEPYTPSIRRLALSYTAQSAEARVGSTAVEDYAQRDLQFFHVGVFGQAQEHGYQRAQLDFVSDTRVPLLPAYNDDGELLIGVTGVGGGDSLSVLFQAAEGSADPDLERQRLEWSVLSDNYWKKLGAAELVRDTTNGFLTSGIVSVVLPSNTTTTNTLLPGGQVWLRAAVPRHPDAVSQLVAVAANAVEVQWIADISPAHLTTPLAAGRIARLATPVAQVKTVTQPFASFGGAPEETDAALRVRAAERLRHRNRAIAAWDYERLVLDAFPAVHKVKCVPHAKDGSWLAPGHVLIVVVPDLKNQNMVDPLQPRVDADTISRIAELLTRQAGMQVRVGVKNPRYQRVRLDFKVRFARGYEFNFYRQQLHAELIRFLSPWAFDATRPIEFGGRIFKSVLLDFVEERPYVDYVTDFRMFSRAGESSGTKDVDEAMAETPDAILVSDATHLIGEVA